MVETDAPGLEFCSASWWYYLFSTKDCGTDNFWENGQDFKFNIIYICRKQVFNYKG